MFNLKLPKKMKRGPKPSATELVKELKRRTRRIFSSEEKIKIVLEGLRGEESIAAICRKYAIHQNLYFKWSKDFMEAGKKRLSGDTVREASTDEVKDLRDKNVALKQELADLFLENKILKKNLNGYE
jgi:transposase